VSKIIPWSELQLRARVLFEVFLGCFIVLMGGVNGRLSFSGGRVLQFAALFILSWRCGIEYGEVGMWIYLLV
jgi:hypothetical protein